MEDGATSPFPTTNSSKRSEPVFNAPSKAWINAQISNHMNELADELSEKVNRVESKLNEAMKLIGTQTTKIRQQETKIMQQEAKISDLMKAKDAANKEIASLKQKLPAPRKLPNPSDEPSQSRQKSIESENNPRSTGSRCGGDNDPFLPQPSRPSQWAESWANTRPRTSTVPPVSGNNSDTDPKLAKQEDKRYCGESQ